MSIEKLEHYRQHIKRKLEEAQLQVDLLSRALESVESEIFSMDETLRCEEFYGRNVEQQDFIWNLSEVELW